MIDKYLEDLQKTARVQEKLEEHLQELTKQAAAKVAREEFLKNASVEELAKLAGIKLPEEVCGSCGAEMQKLGSVLQCRCGMVKKAFSPGAIAGYFAQGDPESTPRSGFWRGLGGGIVGSAVGAIPGALLRSPGLMQAGALAGNVGGGWLAGETAKATPEEMAAYLKKKKMASVKSKQAAAPGMLASAGKFLTGPGRGAMAARVGASTALGAAGGAIAGGEGNRMSGALMGGAAGAAAGGAAGSLGRVARIGKGSLTQGAEVGKSFLDGGRGMASGQKFVNALNSPAMNRSAMKWGLPAAGATGLAAGAMIPSNQKHAAAEDEGVRPGWMAAQRGMNRAMQAGESGLDSLLATSELIGQRLTKGLTHGAAGAGIGALGGGVSGALLALLLKKRMLPSAGVGALGGGALGGLVGDVHGQLEADKGFLADRGITSHWGGLGGATFDPEAAKKYLTEADLPKTAATLMEVGDLAGRLMAKVAETPGLDIDPEEVAEAIEEAKEREDVPGRSRNWAMGGGALGGLAGGGLGYGLSALATKNPWLRAGGAGLGAIAGGAGGGLLGHQQGAEEAEADRLVSFLRGRRAYQTGAQEGLQQGYMAGMTGGGMGEDESDPR